MKAVYIYVILFYVGTMGFAQTTTENYVQTKVYKRASSTPLSSYLNVIEEVDYFDGLGRLMQTIGVDQSPGYSDLVTYIGYDLYGRQLKKYLTYPDASGSAGDFKTGDIIYNTQNYYKIHYGSDFNVSTSSTNPYSETRFEASPLNRPLEFGAPGDSWKVLQSSDYDHTMKMEYLSNSSSEVRKFKVTLSSSLVPSLSNPSPYYYSAGELFKTVSKDENWTSGTNHTSIEYKDKQGRVILKRTYNGTTALDTYYVYDDYGNLSYVLTPKSYPGGGIPNSTELSELCYQYKYDSRNRIIEKKIPGKGWEYIVYNKLDQPIMAQDQNQKAQNQWLFTKYDPFGRIAYTGQQNINTTHAALQSTADGNAAYVSRTTSANTFAGVSVYYTNAATPTSMNEIYTINYYDDYNVNVGFTIPSSTSFGTTIVSGTKTKGLATVTKVRVLGTTNWITTATGYDDKGRVIWTKSVNPYFGTTDIVENNLDFTGTVIQSKTTHQKTGKSDLVINDYFTYDHAKRLTKHTQSINGSSQEVIAENTYDETGQLVSKGVGNTAGNLRLQNVAYSYNVRGWLKGINDVNSTAKLFNFKLYYNDPTSGTPLYNGNISQAQWRTDNTDSSLKTYTYSYDGLNRITSAIDNTGNYNLTGVTYDVNGNIKGLTRKGAINSTSSSFGNMDVLTYGYSSYSNKLLTVNDSGNDTYGFKDGSSATTQYTYDANGNMKTDANKGITGITYNFLNLPESVTLSAGTISYIYDATGTKLRKVAAGTTTDYDGNFLYKNGNLEFFHTEEGYAEPKSTGGYEYIYNYTDHLGNVRLSYMETGTVSAPNVQIVQENNYYPFGLTHKGYNDFNTGLGSSAAKLFKFGGKELQDENNLEWYDFGARNYDAALGRWMNIDPMGEKRIWLSPYNYVQNSPIYLKDIDGLLDGDYYNTQGEHLGDDGINDNKVYVADAKEVKTLEDGTVQTTYTNAKELPISHSEFQKEAATVYGEGSATYGIISKEEMFAIASAHQRNSVAFGSGSKAARSFLSKNVDERKGAMAIANAAIINAVTGGTDYSMGADQWDGADQAMVPESNQELPSNGRFMYKMNVMGWSIKDNHYSSWKSAVEKRFGNGRFSVPQYKKANTNYGGMKNKGKVRLTSTAQYGLTIFWKTNSK